jgi:ubiquinol-cytochrome c reductase iron-sulfur subunit
VAESVVTTEPHGGAPEGDPSRRDFIHIAAGAAAAGAGVMMVWPLINSMNPAADTLALSTIEFDTSKVAEGMQIVITWQGKPVFLRNRSAADLQRVIAKTVTAVHQETDIPGVEAIKGFFKTVIVAQRLQHETVAADHNHYISLIPAEGKRFKTAHKIQRLSSVIVSEAE